MVAADLQNRYSNSNMKVENLISPPPPADRFVVLDDCRAKIRLLEKTGTTIATYQQLSEWIRGPLRDCIPHEKTIIGFGQVGFERIHLDRTYDFDIPTHRLDTEGCKSEELLSPVIKKWLVQREPLVFDSDKIKQLADAKWQHLRNRYQVRNGAFDADVLSTTGRVVFIKLFNLEKDSVISLPQSIGSVTPLLRGIFKRIESAPEVPVSPRNDAILNTFSATELKVLRQLQLGKTNSEIAKSLCRSDFTVKNHIARMLEKSCTKSRHQLAALAEKATSRK